MIIMHVFFSTTIGTTFCGRKGEFGLSNVFIRKEGKHKLYGNERLCKLCERTREYGMLLLEII